MEDALERYAVFCLYFQCRIAHKVKRLIQNRIEVNDLYVRAQGDLRRVSRDTPSSFAAFPIPVFYDKKYMQLLTT